MKGETSVYKVLIVDDEPRVSAGIRNFLLQSDLDIAHAETALNGFEALDCLRMDTYDLVLTDIQMSMMNGIELMEAIFLEQPHLPVIVISAHEKFDFAKKSLRLGARDYLIKPVELDELVRVVGKVLREKKEAGRQTLRDTGRQTFEQRSVLGRRNEALLELLTEKGLQPEDYRELMAEAGDWFAGEGDCFAVALVQLDLSKGGFSNRGVTLKDRKLLKYASINVLEEYLADWGGVALPGFGNRLISVLRLSGQDAGDDCSRRHAQLHLIGKSIHLNLKQYLNVDAVVGISTPGTEAAMLPKLMEEAEAALEWSKIDPNHRVLFYEDMIGLHTIERLEWASQVEALIRRLKASDGADELDELGKLADKLKAFTGSAERFKSCFGLLVYRLYGVLFEYGHETGEALHRFAPDVYFRGLTDEEKAERLSGYAAELSALLRMSMSKRDRTIVSRIAAYIQQHYHNPGLKIQDIAGEVHFSAAYISYLFKKEWKKNIWDYVSEVRIEEAKRLLATTDLKRYEIAYRVGYESPEHFSRMFKRYTGVSPADYRKERQGGLD
jgi:two-component system response regulator YesN